MSGSGFQHRIVEEAPTLRRYARSLTRDDATADDLVQDTLMLALQGQASFREGSGLRGWLLSILHNRFISNRRRDQARNARHERAAADPGGSYEATQEHAVRLAGLERAVLDLPEDQRAALRLVAIEGYSYSDAATALNVPIGTVMSRLSRARAALREAERLPVARPRRSARLRLLPGGRDEQPG